MESRSLTKVKPEAEQQDQTGCGLPIHKSQDQVRESGRLRLRLQHEHSNRCGRKQGLVLFSCFSHPIATVLVVMALTFY